MNGKQMACASVMAAFLGCGTTDEVPDEPGEVFTYVLSTIDNPRPSGQTSVGFDLDGTVSEALTAACNDQPDFVSEDGVRGIDNNFGIVGSSMEPVLLRMRLASLVEPRIAAGEFLLLMEVIDVDSTTSDASVGVRVYLGSATAAIALEDGRIAPGQVLPQVGPDLVNLAPGEAAIVDGVLAFEMPRFPFPIGANADGDVLELHDVHVRAQIDPMALTRGEIGGALHIDEIAGYAGLSPDELRSGVPFDLDPTAADDTICDSMSAGLSFEAVSSVPE